MRRLSFLLLFLILLTGCATVRVVQVPKRVKSASLVAGKTLQTGIGSPMIRDENLYYYDGLITLVDFQMPMYLSVNYPMLPAGTMLKPYGVLSNGDIVYEALKVPRARAYGKPVDWDFCIAVNPNREAYGVNACDIPFVGKWDQPFRELRESKVYTEGTLRKDLIYNGRTGNTIRILYREYFIDLVRPTLTQEITYDIGQSRSIAFRDLKLEVEEATNSYIRFTVISPGTEFTDQTGHGIVTHEPL